MQTLYKQVRRITGKGRSANRNRKWVLTEVGGDVRETGNETLYATEVKLDYKMFRWVKGRMCNVSFY